MKNILVPTDFSVCAKIAENYGIEIAKKAKAEIHFLHLIITPVEWVKISLEREKLFPGVKAKIGQANAELSKLKRRAEKMGLKAKTFLIFDKDREEIFHHLKHHKHDFIVMGSHGASGFKEVLGSNTQMIVRYSPVPVLVVKKKLNKLDIKNIIFASTFEEDVYSPFSKVISFADVLKSNIHLLNVNLPYHFNETDVAEENMESFMKKCPRGKCTINIYNALSEERGIQKFAEKINADVICLTTHGRTGFMKMLSPSITESLVNHSEIPVLSVNIKIN